MSDPSSSSPLENSRSGDSPATVRELYYTGHLVAHGPAPHDFQPAGMNSYFVMLDIEGKVKPIWHPDLGRAVKEAHGLLWRGSLQHLRAIPREHLLFDPHAEQNARRGRPEDRHYWIMQEEPALQLHAQRAALLRKLKTPGTPRPDANDQYPELNDVFAIVDAAKQMAKDILPHKEQRRAYARAVQDALADRVARAEPMPRHLTPEAMRTILIKLMLPKPAPAPEQEHARSAPDVDELAR